MKSLPIDIDFTKAYLVHLKEFFNSIRAPAYGISSYNNSAGTAVSAALSQIDELTRRFGKAKSANNITRTISIEPNIILQMKNKLYANSENKFYISIGGHIDIKNSLLENQSICLMLLFNTNSGTDSATALTLNCHEYPPGTHVLRKFHFDIDRGIEDKSRPVSHLQYGGSFNKEYLQFEREISYHLFSPLDDPRLPNLPYSFPICLDILLRSFDTPAQQFTQEQYWINHIKKSELMWIKPYMENVLTFLENDSRKETLWDFLSSKA